MTDKIPKSKQLYFFLMPEETMHLLEFIAQQGCLIYSDRSTAPKPSESHWRSTIGNGHLFFCPSEFGDKIETHKATNEIYFIDPTISPVIELGCSMLNNNKLSRGRIYFRGGYFGRDVWVPFPKLLYEKFKIILSFIKKSFLSKHQIHGGYISKSSQNFADNGGELLQF